MIRNPMMQSPSETPHEIIEGYHQEAPVDLPPHPAPLAAGGEMIPPSAPIFAEPQAMPVYKVENHQAAEPDFWDISDPEFTGRQVSPDHEFSQLVTSDAARRLRTVGLGVLAALMGFMGYSAYAYFMMGDDPITRLVAFLGGGFEAHAPSDDFMEHLAPLEPALAPEPAPATASLAVRRIEGNPYWHLPNYIDAVQAAPTQRLSADEEEVFRTGLAHQFTYQRHKVVQDIRKHRYAGSEPILWEALQDSKLWTRLFAAVGLAELNTEVPLQDLDAAMKGARSELIANFLERFSRRPNAGQSFILRQLVRLLDERGRLTALRGIAASEGELRDLYLAAATRDPGKHVQKWIKVYLANHPMDPERYNQLLTVVEGDSDAASVMPSLAALSPLTTRAGPSSDLAPLGSTTESLGFATEAEMERELAAFETSTGGDVVFYDDAGFVEDGGAIADVTDLETFEYE